MGIRVGFITLGCKLNQLETESVADAFRHAGAVISQAGSSGGTELFVVNTCTVTGKAEQKARRAIRACLSKEPQAVALITGCYAQMDPEGLSTLHERALVLPGDEKSGLLDLADWLSRHWQGHGDLLDAIRDWIACLGGKELSPFAFSPERFSFHARPSLKIQDGCDRSCSYCRVRLARGQSKSLPPELALERVRALEDAGCAEVVLTGVNISQYCTGKLHFPELLALLINGTGKIAFRISSWEPDMIGTSFLEVFAHSRVRAHAHLPVQSGSDAVLGRMGRLYSRKVIIDAVKALRRVKNDPFIAADMIVGFPGETEADFRDSLELCESCDFAWIHAFQFSARPGTGAAEMRPCVPERVAGQRAELLGDRARAGRRDYAVRQEGRRIAAVIEEKDGPHSFGTSDNYLKIRIDQSDSDCLALGKGNSVNCRLGKPCELADVEAFLEISPQ